MIVVEGNLVSYFDAHSRFVDWLLGHFSAFDPYLTARLLAGTPIGAYLLDHIRACPARLRHHREPTPRCQQGSVLDRSSANRLNSRASSARSWSDQCAIAWLRNAWRNWWLRSARSAPASVSRNWMRRPSVWEATRSR